MRSLAYLLIPFNFFIQMGEVSARGPLYALLIGISSYEDIRWSQPLSSINDVRIIRNTLIERGFDENNITILQDREATQLGIINAFQALISKVDTQSIVYIHFSGHGQQIYDRKPYLDEEDGYDESIVPFDAPKFYHEGLLNDERHIRDDVLNETYSAIRKKIGPGGSLLVVIDACHAGSSARSIASDAIVRGADNIYRPPDYHPITVSRLSERFESSLPNPSWAPLTAFFACGPQELNYETRMGEMGLGSLTYAFVTALRQSDASTSYAYLFEKIKGIMASIAPKQLPQYEGQIHLPVFGSQLKQFMQHYLVSGIHEDTLYISGGILDEITPGTRMRCYYPDTDTAVTMPIAEGVIQESGLTNSQLRIQGFTPALREPLMQSWVFVSEKRNPYKVGISMVRISDPTAITYLSGIPFLSFTDNNPHLRAWQNKRKDSLFIENKYGYLIASVRVPMIEASRSTIQNAVLQSAKAEFFRNYQVSLNPDFAVSLSLLALLDTSTRSQKDSFPINDHSGNYVINEGTTVVVAAAFSKILPYDLYYGLLDIQPDDKINILTSHESASSYVVKKRNRAFTSRPFEISPPYGRECLLLILSREPVDLSNLSGRRGANTPWADIFRDMIDVSDDFSSRGGAKTNSTSVINSAFIKMLSFEIRKN